MNCIAPRRMTWSEGQLPKEADNERFQDGAAVRPATERHAAGPGWHADPMADGGAASALTAGFAARSGHIDRLRRCAALVAF